MKRLLPTAALAAAATLALAGCGATSGGAADGEVTISFAHWGNNQEAETLAAMVEAFEAEYPDINVEENWIQSDYELKLQVSIAGGEAPTVSQISNTSLASFADAYQEVAVDPDAYYSPNIPNSMKVGDSYRAVPFVVKTKVMAVNGSVFDAAGVERPSATEPMSVEQFAEVAQEVTSGNPPDKVYGSARLWYDGFLTAGGGGFFNEDGTKCAIGSPVAIETAELVMAAQQPEGYAPTGADAEGQDMFDWLSIGRLAMQPDFGPWDIAKLVAVNDPNIYLAPDPGQGLPMEINGLGISEDASDAETKAATAFVEFMSTNPDAQDLLTTAESSLGVPVIEESVPAFEAAAPELDLALFVSAVDQSVIQPSVKGIVQIQTEFWNEFNARSTFGSGTEDPADVLPELQEACQATLDSLNG
jgi:ABC-type glycerol-3-phosphate transport system substrate-binding protein